MKCPTAIYGRTTAMTGRRLAFARSTEPKACTISAAGGARCVVFSCTAAVYIRYNSVFNASRDEALHVCGGKTGHLVLSCVCLHAAELQQSLYKRLKITLLDAEVCRHVLNTLRGLHLYWRCLETSPVSRDFSVFKKFRVNPSPIARPDVALIFQTSP